MSEPAAPSQHWGQLHNTFSDSFTDDINPSELSVYSTVNASHTNVFLETHLASNSSPASPAHSVECTIPFRNPKFQLLTRLRPGQAKLQLKTSELSEQGQFRFRASVHIPTRWEASRFEIGNEIQYSNSHKTGGRLLYRMADQNITLQYKYLQETQETYSGLATSYELNQSTWNAATLQYGWKFHEGRTRFGFMTAVKAAKNKKINPLALVNNACLSVIHKVNEYHTVGGEIKWAGGQVGWHYSPGDEFGSELKVRADTDRNVDIGIGQSIADYGRYALGMRIADFGGDNRCSYGLRVDLAL